MGNIQVEIMPPLLWQDFERLTLDVCKKHWKDDYAWKNGREGQNQDGVDVFGRNEGKNTGVQCKKRKNKSANGENPSSTLTIQEIDEEVAKAKEFRPKLDRFIIATTGFSDTKLLQYVAAKYGPQESLPVSLWFWDDYTGKLENYPDLMYLYYENILRYRNNYKPDIHYLQMLANAFNRPAIKTPFYLENSVENFINAIEKLQQAVSSGVLKDKDGLVIDNVLIPKKKTAERKVIEKNLQKIRKIVTKGMLDGTIRQPTEHTLYISDAKLVQNINELKKEMLEKLNALLSNANIDVIEIDEGVIVIAPYVPT